MKDNEETKLKGDLLRKYAASVFGDTLVTGVPNIVNTHSWPRKIFKLSVLLFCISGFLYQTIQFLSHVFSYPSIVDISVRTPSHYLFPAITICNNNGIMRSKFCHKYPDRCEQPSNKTVFCDENPTYSHHCKNDTEWESFAVPKREFHKYEMTASLKDLKELTQEQELLFSVSLFPDINMEDAGIKGPLAFFKNAKRYFSCYTIHSRADSSEDAQMLVKNPWSGLSSIVDFEVDFEPSETFLPGRMPGGFIAIHSPFEFFNPFEYGHRLRPGKFYKIHVNMGEEELLPYPYKTDCTNYTEKWLDNGRKGPRGQEMCKLSCLFDITMKSCNHTFKSVVYPYGENVSFDDSMDCIQKEIFSELENCFETCKDECNKNKFSYELQERDVEDIDEEREELSRNRVEERGELSRNRVWESEEDKEEQKTYISLYLSDPEVVVYTYRPHYQSIEVFGCIGGYIGAWLGISLVAVVDFVECLVLVITFAFRRRKQTEGGKVPPLQDKST